MTERQIQLTDSDAQRLTCLLDKWHDRREDNGDLKHLEYEVQRARLVKPREISKDVVTMNSRVRIRDLDSGDSVAFSLVYPSFLIDEDGPPEMTVSVFAPMGTAVLGCRVGDAIEWEVPGGKRRLKVEEVLYQPEAAGRFDL